jgi:hypothetical protein
LHSPTVVVQAFRPACFTFGPQRHREHRDLVFRKDPLLAALQPQDLARPGIVDQSSARPD